ncbi:adenosylcobinamide-GDP ribazoletransferase [Fulvivirga sediminis]|uniref:Adenosylcobinamide-GDP ribazoletransferase n=1 Tax=Fulvivirga sediminis TaxID=2803949 RepID=A0A937K209_9BACT|nr:adenosylcobinamide-GDP ribazoletransferase [Fulvivirga sediminis]MBL3657282.1 adenosylcobinamide-GDP ribazoletransferase [Fulvivirga sediminis]
MKEQIRVFFTALMFYTRIPCPKSVDHSPEYINKSIRYFPLIGWIVGGIAAVAFLIGAWTVNPTVGIVLSIIASVLTTGAFHEDGFADVCDGFGGGWTKEKILVIMKDSRMGAYGVIGMILILLLKTSLLVEVSTLTDLWTTLITMVSAHTMSRLMAATFVFTHPYVRDTDDSKAKPIAQQANNTNLIIATFFGVIPFIGLTFITYNVFLLAIIPLLYVVKMWLARYFTKWIGGYTGDCLGAMQQVTEVAFYLFFILIWKFTL